MFKYLFNAHIFFLDRHWRLALLRPVHGYIVKHIKRRMEATPKK